MGIKKIDVELASRICDKDFSMYKYCGWINTIRSDNYFVLDKAKEIFENICSIGDYCYVLPYDALFVFGNTWEELEKFNKFFSGEDIKGVFNKLSSVKKWFEDNFKDIKYVVLDWEEYGGDFYRITLDNNEEVRDLAKKFGVEVQEEEDDDEEKVWFELGNGKIVVQSYKIRPRSVPSLWPWEKSHCGR